MGDARSVLKEIPPKYEDIVRVVNEKQLINEEEKVLQTLATNEVPIQSYVEPVWKHHLK